MNEKNNSTDKFSSRAAFATVKPELNHKLNFAARLIKITINSSRLSTTFLQRLSSFFAYYCTINYFTIRYSEWHFDINSCWLEGKVLCEGWLSRVGTRSVRNLNLCVGCAEKKWRSSELFWDQTSFRFRRFSCFDNCFAETKNENLRESSREAFEKDFSQNVSLCVDCKSFTASRHEYAKYIACSKKPDPVGGLPNKIIVSRFFCSNGSQFNAFSTRSD